MNLFSSISDTKDSSDLHSCQFFNICVVSDVVTNDDVLETNGRCLKLTVIILVCLVDVTIDNEDSVITSPVIGSLPAKLTPVVVWVLNVDSSSGISLHTADLVLIVSHGILVPHVLVRTSCLEGTVLGVFDVVEPQLDVPGSLLLAILDW